MLTMTWLEQPLISARVFLLPFAIILFSIILLYNNILKAFAKNAPLKYILGCLCGGLYFLVVIVQIVLFSRISGIERPTNDFVAFLVLLLENLISIGILLYSLKNLRRAGTDVP